MTDNMRFWDALCRTDPKATKPFQRSGFRGTQIDPVWRYKRMTEKFGPIGEGWGYEITRDPIIADGLAFVCVRAWWKGDDGERHYTGEQWGGDVLFKARREGPPVPNDEALKMATTDAVGKALVLLGLGADVHMGQFDDSKYRAEVDREYRAKENGKGTGSSAGSEHRTPTPKAAGSSPAPSAKYQMVDPSTGEVVAEYKIAKDFMDALQAEMRDGDPLHWWGTNQATAKRIREEIPRAAAHYQQLEQMVTAIPA